MREKWNETLQAILDQRFGCDTLLALATAVDNLPSVRTVNSYYEDGAFYIITDARSDKMQQIARNPAVAVSGEWFTAHGRGENLGHLLAPENAEIADKLQTVFAEWYDNGHIREQDPNTCILRVQLTDGVLFEQGVRHDIDFLSK